MDNWYNKQFTTNPDKNDKSLNATALAVLLLRDAPRYWHRHPNLDELERRVPVVAHMLGDTEGTFARILRDLGFASTQPVVRNIRALGHYLPCACQETTLATPLPKQRKGERQRIAS